MLGAIIGDIVGSRFEFRNNKSKDFEFFHEKCFFTDDSVMTLAIAEAIIEAENNFEDLSNRTICCLKEIGRNYPNCGYGGMFRRWMYSEMTEPYNSYGNGAAMRVSVCGFVGQSLDEVKELSRKVTEITHNHPEGLKGAEATSVAIYLARTGSTIKEIEEYIDKNYYPMNFTLDEIRPKYAFKESCQETVPQAIKAFLESTSFEDAIRNAISIGGDSDTIGAITGGIAEAYYGIPEEMKVIARAYLDGRLKKICEDFERVYPNENEIKNEYQKDEFILGQIIDNLRWTNPDVINKVRNQRNEAELSEEEYNLLKIKHQKISEDYNEQLEYMKKRYGDLNEAGKKYGMFARR